MNVTQKQKEMLLNTLQLITYVILQLIKMLR